MTLREPRRPLVVHSQSCRRGADRVDGYRGQCPEHLQRRSLERQSRRGAQSCPDATELRREIDQRLGHDPWDYGAPSIAVTIAPSRSGVTAAIIQTGEDGRPLAVRQIDSPRGCEELRPSLVLILSIALDRQSRQVYAQKAIEPPSRGSTSDDRRLTWWGGGGALFVVNAGPEPLLGGNFFAESRWDNLTFDLEGRGVASGSISTPGVGGSFRLLQIESAFAPCYRRSIFLGCALVEAGAVVVWVWLRRGPPRSRCHGQRRCSGRRRDPVLGEADGQTIVRLDGAGGSADRPAPGRNDVVARAAHWRRNQPVPPGATVRALMTRRCDCA